MSISESDSKITKKEITDKGRIIKTKVSVFRRTIEILITVMLNITILGFLSLLVDSIYAMTVGQHLFYPWMPLFVTQIMWVGILVAFCLFLFFFFLASSWQFFKGASYPDTSQKAEEPARVTDIELSEYFQLPLTEIQSRQDANELIIYENISDGRIKELRKIYDKNR